MLSIYLILHPALLYVVKVSHVLSMLCFSTSWTSLNQNDKGIIVIYSMILLVQCNMVHGLENLYSPKSFCTRLSTESFEGSVMAQVSANEGVARQESVWRTIRMVLGRNLEQCGERLLVPVHCRPDLLRNLKRQDQSRAQRRRSSPRTCWFMSKIAISLRSVNSWNAASIACTCVSKVPRC